MKIPDVSGLMTTTVVNTKIGKVEKKIPNFSDLIKKADYNAKISDIEENYFTTSEYIKFTSKIFETKIKEKELVDKCNISKSRKNSDLKGKFATLVDLKAEQDKIVKLLVFDSGYFLGKSHVEDDGAQNYLVRQPICN